MIKDLDDYLDGLQEKYPYLSRHELKRVMEHGFETFYTLNKKGADIKVKSPKYSAFCGKLFFDNYIRSLYNSAKTRIKLRLNYRYAHEVYTGSYFFGLTDAEWEFYNKKLFKKRRNKITFKDIRLFRIKEEAFIDKSKKYFLEVHYPIDIGWTFIEKEFTTRNFTYIAKRDSNGKIVLI